MAVEDFLHVRRQEVDAGVIFVGLGIVGGEDQIEVVTVSRRIRSAYEAGEQQPPKPRSWLQPQEGVAEDAEKGGKANAQVLVQAPALTRSLTERVKRDSDPAHHLDVLLRHRPPVLPDHVAMPDTRIMVRLRARSRADELLGIRDGVLHARVSAPPVDGRANRALCRLIADRAGVAPSKVSVLRGQRSRDKLIRVEGVQPAALHAALTAGR